MTRVRKGENPWNENGKCVFVHILFRVFIDVHVNGINIICK